MTGELIHLLVHQKLGKPIEKLRSSITLIRFFLGPLLLYNTAYGDFS